MEVPRPPLEALALPYAARVVFRACDDGVAIVVEGCGEDLVGMALEHLRGWMGVGWMGARDWGLVVGGGGVEWPWGLGVG